MKGFKFTILSFLSALFFLTACQEFDNSLDGSTWLRTSGNGDTIETYVFEGTHSGTYTITIPNPNFASQDTTFTNSNITYSYSENHKTISITRQLTRDITGNFYIVDGEVRFQAGIGDCVGGNTVYSGSLIEGEMRVTQQYDNVDDEEMVFEKQ